mmetsp:Transcript_18789/g.39386  ORF Transcript_18789/g.39386 Transcript_18789/m.39386 type:complete len:135 (+) Transcript_18789:1008-1412(+)
MTATTTKVANGAPAGHGEQTRVKQPTINLFQSYARRESPSTAQRQKKEDTNHHPRNPPTKMTTNATIIPNPWTTTVDKGEAEEVTVDHEAEAEEGVEGETRMGIIPTLPRTPENNNKTRKIQKGNTQQLWLLRR